MWDPTNTQELLSCSDVDQFLSGLLDIKKEFRVLSTTKAPLSNGSEKGEFWVLPVQGFAHSLLVCENTAPITPTLG
jgi:hypothetical protein